MAAIERFEDIEAWKKARQLTASIYRISSSGAFGRDFGLRDQIRRASVSVMSNIAEGFERRGDREFARFLHIAKGSAAEVRAQLYVGADVGFITRDQLDDLKRNIEEISRMIHGLIRSLTTS